MERFLVLYMAPMSAIEEMMRTTTEEEREAGMAEWVRWMNDHKNSFSDMGAPAGKTKRMTVDGVTDVKNDVTGYSVVQAESHEAAAKLFEDMPHFQIPGAYVDVMRITEMKM